MAKLNQVIAIEKGAKSAAYSALTNAHKLVQKPEIFSGFTKIYTPRDEEGEPLPPDTKAVQEKMANVLTSICGSQSDSWQQSARKEWSNTAARADIVVNGDVILPDVPVTYLLQLEKQLVDMRTFISHFPELDATEAWTYDASSDQYRTEAVRTTRTKKVQRPIVLYDATPEHPAQTQLVSEDVLVGYWATTKVSSAVPHSEKRQYLTNVDALLRAVKEAREAANSIDEVPTPNVGDTLINYIFAE